MTTVPRRCWQTAESVLPGAWNWAHGHWCAFRESFRPFAPAVLLEDCRSWFATTESSDTDYLLPESRRPVPGDLRGLRTRLDFKRCAFPSIVHVGL